jgi:hypothetical protein
MASALPAPDRQKIRVSTAPAKPFYRLANNSGGVGFRHGSQL